MRDEIDAARDFHETELRGHAQRRRVALASAPTRESAPSPVSLAPQWSRRRSEAPAAPGLVGHHPASPYPPSWRSCMREQRPSPSITAPAATPLASRSLHASNPIERGLPRYANTRPISSSVNSRTSERGTRLPVRSTCDKRRRSVDPDAGVLCDQVGQRMARSAETLGDIAAWPQVVERGQQPPYGGGVAPKAPRFLRQRRRLMTTPSNGVVAPATYASARPRRSREAGMVVSGRIAPAHPLRGRARLVSAAKSSNQPTLFPLSPPLRAARIRYNPEPRRAHANAGVARVDRHIAQALG